MKTELSETRPYLTFTLGKELFAVDVAQVREVLDLTTITKIPRTPDYMRGVINLRGSVVPVIDLRLKFGLPAVENTRNTCIIVMEIVFEDETLVLGALADAVQEVFELEPNQIEPAPRLGTKFKADFLKGMGKRDETFIIILDIDKAFSGEELLMVQENNGLNLDSIPV